MSKLINDLQKQLKWLKDFKEYPTKLRLSDFSNFVKNLNKWKEDYVEDILLKLKLNQQELATQTDSLLELISDLLENKENDKTDQVDWFIEWKEFKANELHRFFHTHASHQRYLNYYFKTPMSLWRVLNTNAESYKNIHWILITSREIRSNQKVYSIAKIERKD
jgi:hypothetical protein